MQTVKLYDINSYLREFTAEILSCEKSGEIYNVILDKTAFFPEGGGQPSDTGTINGIDVFDVQINDGVIIHKTKTPLPVGSAECLIDWDES